MQMNLFTKQKQTSRLREWNLRLPGGKNAGDSWGVWDGHVHTAIFKMGIQQEATVEHRELCSMLCGSLDGRGVWGSVDTRVCVAELLCCAPETITTLTGYIHPNTKIKTLKKESENRDYVELET